MKRDVFISYATHDKPVADAVCHALEARGVRCWIAPRDIPPGDDYPERLVRAIAESRVFVLVFSSHANASKYVRREVHLGFEHGLTTIPFRIEPVEPGPGLEFHLRMIHWLDALTEPLENHLRTLADRVAQIVAAERSLQPEDEAASAGPVSPASGALPRAPRAPARGWIPALGRALANPYAPALALGLLPLVADFVLHLHIGPPWPSRIAVALGTGLLSMLGFLGLGMALPPAPPERLRLRLVWTCAGMALSLAVYAVAFSEFVVTAPTAHDEDVGGFQLLPKVQHLMETVPGLTAKKALEGGHNDPEEVWVLWTIVVGRICVLAAWFALNGCLAAALAFLRLLVRGSSARAPAPAEA